MSIPIAPSNGRPAPRSHVGMRRLAVSAVLSLALSGAAWAAPVVDAPERAADREDKMICKRFVETGSLVKGYRTCKTKREWERDRLNIRTSNLMSGGCNSAESGNCLGSSTVAGITTPRGN